MEIRTDEKKHCISVDGRIDANTCNDLDHAMTALLETGGDLIIDLSECVYISSAGIRVLLKTKKILKGLRRELYLTGVAPAVFHVFEMADLHRVLHFEKSVDAALATIHATSSGAPEEQIYPAGYHSLVFRPCAETPFAAYLCPEPAVLSLHELGYAIGFGAISNAEETCNELFGAMGHFTGFVSTEAPEEADFRMVSEPARTGFHVCEAFSFGQEPAGILQLKEPGMITFDQLGQALRAINSGRYSGNAGMMLVVINHDNDKPSLSLLLAGIPRLRQIARENRMHRMAKYLEDSAPEGDFRGISFLLSEPVSVSDETPLQEIMRRITIDQITGVQGITPSGFLHNPHLRVFAVNAFSGMKSRLLPIETTGQPLPPYMEFLARLLYNDSSRLVLTPLTGGYSSLAFQVISFDHEGRKMRPTVMKVGKRSLISREAERCKMYALPYIFNNSAVVLGSEYHGDQGALRYNFVGIGGEESRLNWLSHYYRQKDLAFLEPLFDKIFLGILKPWYGQPVNKVIHPYLEHDPTFTFFPHIYKTAAELLSIDADDMYLRIPESSRPILNPYWFLKHEFPRRRDRALEYPTGICHGDLNMNNILLDEHLNVHLIDFSETRPRPVISDFARLEAIFLVDLAPLGEEGDMTDYLNFIREFYRPEKLNDFPKIVYRGKHADQVLKNGTMALKMRQYALDATGGNPDPLPWYLALLEWVIPIVCYFSMPEEPKRLSMIVSSILCEKIMER